MTGGKASKRTRQVSDVVRAELSRLLRVELRDPAIGFATITSVEMSGDLRSARAFVSCLGGPETFTRSVEALNHAAGRLRGLVGRNCGLRHAPELHFVEDHSVERGARIEQLLNEIRKDEATPGSPAESDADPRDTLNE